MALILPKPLTTLLAEPDTDPQWLISPILPAQGITFLHGRFSLGKSPLTWKIAQAVSDGTPFFRMPVNTSGPVLYIEVDTPERQVKPRLRLMTPVAKQVYMANGYPRLNLMTNSSPEVIELTRAYEDIKPVLVIINTLRKVHDFDQNVAETPNLVYSNLLSRFPNSALMIVHHDRKSSSVEDFSDQDERFSGSQSWANDATIALHLRSINKAERRLELVVTKSQVSATGSCMKFTLSEDGTNFIESDEERAQTIFASLPDSMKKEEKIHVVMDQLKKSRSTVYNYLKFPEPIVQLGPEWQEAQA
jgi:RecA-family ATPase